MMLFPNLFNLWLNEPVGTKDYQHRVHTPLAVCQTQGMVCIDKAALKTPSGNGACLSQFRVLYITNSWGLGDLNNRFLMGCQQTHWLLRTFLVSWLHPHKTGRTEIISMFLF